MVNIMLPVLEDFYAAVAVSAVYGHDLLLLFLFRVDMALMVWVLNVKLAWIMLCDRFWGCCYVFTCVQKC